MKDIFANTTTRERLFLAAGGLILLVFTLHQLIFSPFFSSLERYRNDLPMKRETLSWMQKSQREVAKLMASGRSIQAAGKGASPLVAIEKTTKQWKLDTSLKRVEPEGESGVKVWIEEAIFDDLILWLQQLQNEYGITVDTLTVESKNAPGYVDARITFAGAVQ